MLVVEGVVNFANYTSRIGIEVNAFVCLWD